MCLVFIENLISLAWTEKACGVLLKPPGFSAVRNVHGLTCSWQLIILQISALLLVDRLKWRAELDV